MTGLTRELRFRAAGVLGHGLLGSLFLTTRCRRERAENYLRFRHEGTPIIFVLWHAHLLPLVYYHRKESVVVLVSEHTDGEYIARVLRRHGFGTVRGSSTRGGVKGLKALIRAARAGHDLAITPDGPQGPREKFKWGALAAGRATGLPIVPVSVGAWPSWRLERSWDRFLVPKPMARVEIEYGAPRWIPREAGEDRLREIAHQLEEELVEAGSRTQERARGRAPGDGDELE